MKIESQQDYIGSIESVYYVCINSKGFSKILSEVINLHLKEKFQ